MKKILMALVALACMVGGFAFDKAEIRAMSDKELVEMMAEISILESTGVYGVAALLDKGISLEEYGQFKSAVKAEYNRRTNPSVMDKAKDKASKASDWFWGKVGISE